MTIALPMQKRLLHRQPKISLLLGAWVRLSHLAVQAQKGAWEHQALLEERQGHQIAREEPLQLHQRWHHMKGMRLPRQVPLRRISGNQQVACPKQVV